MDGGFAAGVMGKGGGNTLIVHLQANLDSHNQQVGLKIIHFHQT
jgi:hypothetical protein